MREIVGARLGNYVTNDPATIQRMLAKEGNAVSFIDRAQARRIAYIIGGEQRHAIANGPTLFLIDASGEIVEVERG